MKKRWVALCLALVMVFTAPGALKAQAKVELGQIGSLQALSKKEYAIVPGVTETDLVMNNEARTYQNKGFVMEVDLKREDVSIMAGYKDYQGTSWGMQTCLNQAKAAEKALKRQNPNANVVGIINASFFNMGTGEPSGAMVMQGTVYHQTAPNYGYFAVHEDGTAAIYDGSTPIAPTVKEAIAGYHMLLRNGVNVASFPGEYEITAVPRTAIGIREDGTVVLFVVDGRQAPSSSGMSIRELGEVMISLGCRDALNLDGGGSSTFATKREGTSALTVKNSPSDGYERNVSGTLMVVSTAAPSGDRKSVV